MRVHLMHLFVVTAWNSYCCAYVDIDLNQILLYLKVDNTKSHMTLKKQKKTLVNPFIKLIEDKIKIADAVKDGKPLSTLKDIKFVKPL